jgi:hypothetical protein
MRRALSAAVSVRAAKGIAEATENRLAIGPELCFRGSDGGLVRLHSTHIVCVLGGVELRQRGRERGLVRLQERLRVLVKLTEILSDFHVREAQCRAVGRHRGGVAGGFVGSVLLHNVLYECLILLDCHAIGLQVRRERRLGGGL